jgi:hypothetical protein
MFSRYTSCPAQIILEIDPEKSRDVLLSNRDSLKNEYQQELDKFLSEIAADKNSVGRESKNHTKFYGSPMRLQRKNGKVVKTEKTSMKRIASDFHQPLYGSHQSASGSGSQCFIETGFVPKSRCLIEQTSEKESEFYDDMLKGMVLSVETTDPKLRMTSWHYDPKNWKNGAGGTKMKLLKIWAVACRTALQELMESSKIDEISFGVGFIFSSDAKAMCKNQDGSHYMLINPVGDDGTMRYSIRNRDDYSALIAEAVHEVTHVIQDSHDEDFSSAMTNLVGRTYARMPEMIKEIKAILN